MDFLEFAGNIQIKRVLKSLQSLPCIGGVICRKWGCLCIIGSVLLRNISVKNA